MTAVFTNKGTLRPGIAGRLLRENIPVAYGPDGCFYTYEHGVYVLDDGERRIRRMTRDLLGETEVRAPHYGAVLADMLAMAPKLPNEPHPRLINVANGMLDWRTLELLPHDPSHLSVSQVPWPWGPDAAEPERVLAFLRSVVDSEEDVVLLQEVAGYTLYPGNPFKMAVMLHSRHPDSGKGTYLRLLTEMLGTENVSAHSLHSISENRFAAADLLNKFANVNGDLDARAIGDSSLFKQLTGQDLIAAERKGKPFFAFRCTALPIFAANELPGSADKTDAWYSRWTIVPFPHRFARTPGFEDGLRGEAEMAGFLRLAIEGLRRIMARASFGETASTRQASDEYRAGTDPLVAWLTATGVVTGEAKDRAKGGDLRQAFNNWLMVEEPNTKMRGSRAFFASMGAQQGVEKATAKGVVWFGGCRLPVGSVVGSAF